MRTYAIIMLRRVKRERERRDRTETDSHDDDDDDNDNAVCTYTMHSSICAFVLVHLSNICRCMESAKWSHSNGVSVIIVGRPPPRLLRSAFQNYPNEQINWRLKWLFRGAKKKDRDHHSLMSIIITVINCMLSFRFPHHHLWHDGICPLAKNCHLSTTISSAIIIYKHSFYTLLFRPPWNEWKSETQNAIAIEI